MKRFVAVLSLVVSGACMAQADEWLTIMGNKTDPAVDTIQVNPIPVSMTEDHRVMKIRVSRSMQRTNWDGIPFRSYQATVDFDCENKVGNFQQISYYRQPLWTGESHITTTYGKADPRLMQFRGVVPNPVERIVRAACRPLSRN
ncbi:MAG: surface-adhesin E family protein [Pseudomonadota bacterium]